MQPRRACVLCLLLLLAGCSSGAQDAEPAAAEVTGATGASGAAPVSPAEGASASSSAASMHAGGAPAAVPSGSSGPSGMDAMLGAAGTSAAAVDGGGGGSGSGSAGVAAVSGGAGAGVGPGTPTDAGPAGAAGGDAPGLPAGGAGAAAQPGPKLPAVMSVEGPGPFQTVQDLRTGPMGQSGLFRPQELGKDGLLHPVFVWGCGGTASPSSYASELTQIASHGFVVIAEVENIGDDGAPLLAALDWILAENDRADSALYHKLNTQRLGLGGHSIGSVNSFLAGTDPRWTTTLHVAGGSLDDVNDPSAPTTGMGGKALIHPTAYICSESDVFGNVEKTEKDYANTTVPVFFTIISGAEHIGAVSEGLPVIIAWLRWQLGDEAERRSDFLDPMGMFATGRYSSRTKNW